MELRAGCLHSLLAIGLLVFTSNLHLVTSISQTESHQNDEKEVRGNPVQGTIMPKYLSGALKPAKYWEIAAKEDAEERLPNWSLGDLWTEGAVKSPRIHPEFKAQNKGTEKPNIGLLNDMWNNKGQFDIKVHPDVETERFKEFPDLILPTNTYGPSKMCSNSAKGKTPCLDISECKKENVNYHFKKFKFAYCQKSNGDVGVCCPDISSSSKRPKRQSGDNFIDIEEEFQEATGTIDLTKIGDYANCGHSSKQLSRVQGAQVAQMRDYPWIVALLTREELFHYCGGTLITNRHVLTAAHCVPKVLPEKILIRLGEYDFNRVNDTKAVDAEVEAIQSHEDYDAATYENDIALITLKRDVKYDVYVNPVCLPLPNDTLYKTNATTVVAGWGATEYGGPMSDILMEVPVPIWNQEECGASFTQTIYDTVMCAGGYEGGKDSCQGDSGGPLVSQREDGRWVTMGIVSWGVRCGEKGKPGIYTRVNEYLDWIASHIN